MVDAQKNTQRLELENNLNEEADWLKYIQFELKHKEIKRAKTVYERAL
jgi:hypothetical protein